MSKIKLSVLCITYNHEKFIRQALDGFVMQKTNFPFEVIIHDDASTDGTADIIREYAKKYPKIIKPIFQTENQWSKGKLPLIHFMLDKVKGKYVAMCEGDDYWTDENKLQTQVDFLDKNPDFSICFHPVRVIWDDKSNPDTIFPTPDFIFNRDVLSLDDLLKHNFIQTNSVVYRWNLTEQDWPKQKFLPADYLFHLIHAKHGKIKYLNKVMAVYRKHAGGIWAGAGQTEDFWLRCGLLQARFYDIIQKKFNVDKNAELKESLLRTVLTLLKYNRFTDTESIRHEFPKIYNEIMSEMATNEFQRQNKDAKRAKHKKRLIYYTCGFLVVALFILCFFAL